MKRLLLLISIFFLPSSIFHLPSCYAAQWIQKGETAFAEGETADTEICGVGASAGISLEAINLEKWGNNFIIENQQEFKLNDSDYKISFRFTLFSDKNVDKLHFYISDIYPPAPTYTIGLQTNNSQNEPSGIWVSSNSFPSPAGGYWRSLSITPASLSAGTTYHLVIQYLSGTIGNNNYISLGYTAPLNYRIPYDNSMDPMSEVYICENGINWDYKQSQPVFVLEDSSIPSYEGNPFPISEDMKIYGPSAGPCQWWGEEFTITDKDISVSEVDFYVRSYGGIPPDDLYVILNNETDSELMESGVVVSKNDIKSYYEWCTYVFSSPHTLKKGKKYQLYLKSPSSNDEKCYQVKVLNISPVVGDHIKPEFLSTTYAGEDAFNIRWTESGKEEYKFRDMVFYFFSATYRINGQFISKVFDAGSSSEFKEISWEPTAQPSPASLKFQIAASDNSGGPWLFLGPDGTEASYYTDANGHDISSRHSGKRYIKYKAFFETSDSSYSPYLNKVTIEYAARPLSGRSLEAYNTPNPFEAGRELTTISYILEKDCRVYIRIYTLLGDLVKEMKFSPGEEGGRGETDGYENNVSWDGKNGRGMLVADGVYLSQIIAEPDDGSKIIKEIRKIAVIK